MANQQASLGSLPEEIILKIVKLVPKDGLTRLGTKDALFTLSLVNKKLRRIAVEQIFHTIRRTSPEAFIRLLHTQDCRILRRAGLQVYNCNCPLFIPFPYTGDVPEALNLTKHLTLRWTDLRLRVLRQEIRANISMDKAGIDSSVASQMLAILLTAKKLRFLTLCADAAVFESLELQAEVMNATFDTVMELHLHIGAKETFAAGSARIFPNARITYDGVFRD